MSKIQVVKIIKDIEENNLVKTFLFKYSRETIPGQFFMIWIPGIDEIPMSVSYIYKEMKGITFKKVGEATDALFRSKKGDRIGIRGPYGNGFPIAGKHILFVGGGTGIAMIAPAIELAKIKGITLTVVIGVKTSSELFFVERLKKCSSNFFITTDDGTIGYRGIASDLAKKIVTQETFTSILTCGPELMMKKIYQISGNTPFYASLERYIKCGIGICGQCCVGPGLRVCVEGPIFDRKTLGNIKDFGWYKRDASGRKVFLDEQGVV